MKFKLEVLIAKRQGVDEIRSYLIDGNSEVEAEAALETVLADEGEPEYTIFKSEQIFPNVTRRNT